MAILNLNQTASELYGYSREEMMQMALLDLSAEPEKTRETLDRQVPGSPCNITGKKTARSFPPISHLPGLPPKAGPS